MKVKADSESQAGLLEDIRAGFEAIERGEYDDYDEHTTKDLAANIKARGRLALAKESNLSVRDEALPPFASREG